MLPRIWFTIAICGRLGQYLENLVTSDSDFCMVTLGCPVAPLSVSKRGLQIPMNIFGGQVEISITYALDFYCFYFS